MTDNKVYLKTVDGRRRFFALHPVKSDVSGEPIDVYGYFVRCFSRKGLGSKVFVCTQEEIKKIKTHDKTVPVTFNPKLYDYVETNIIHCSLELPVGAYLFTNPKVSLKHSKNLDVFSVADRQVGGEVVVDRTNHSFRLSSRNASDYDSLEHRDQALLSRDEKTLSSSPSALLIELQEAGFREGLIEKEEE